MDALTIEELANLTGMSVRNIRAYQAKHLLHGPSYEGRYGRYDESHLERIELIRRLQDEGFNLDAARILIEQGEIFTSEVARLRESISSAASAPDATWIPMSDGAVSIAHDHGPDTVSRLIEAELLRQDDEGQLWVRPEFQIGWRLFELGLPHSALYELLFAVERHVRPLARVYVDQVEKHLLPARQRDEDPDAVTDLGAVRDEFDELTLVVTRLMTAAFEVAIRRELHRALEARLRSRRRRTPARR